MVLKKFNPGKRTIFTAYSDFFMDNSIEELITSDLESIETKKVSSLPSALSFMVDVSGSTMGLTVKLCVATGVIIMF